MDYSKWDNLDDSDDDESEARSTAPPAAEPVQQNAAGSATEPAQQQDTVAKMLTTVADTKKEQHSLDATTGRPKPQSTAASGAKSHGVERSNSSPSKAAPVEEVDWATTQGPDGGRYGRLGKDCVDLGCTTCAKFGARLSACSRCAGPRRYCSAQCLKADWTSKAGYGHKADCKAVVSRANEMEAEFGDNGDLYVTRTLLLLLLLLLLQLPTNAPRPPRYRNSVVDLYRSQSGVRALADDWFERMHALLSKSTSPTASDVVSLCENGDVAPVIAHFRKVRIEGLAALRLHSTCWGSFDKRQKHRPDYQRLADEAEILGFANNMAIHLLNIQDVTAMACGALGFFVGPFDVDAAVAFTREAIKCAPFELSTFTRLYLVYKMRLGAGRFKVGDAEEVALAQRINVLAGLQSSDNVIFGSVCGLLVTDLVNNWAAFEGANKELYAYIAKRKEVGDFALGAEGLISAQRVPDRRLVDPWGECDMCVSLVPQRECQWLNFMIVGQASSGKRMEFRMARLLCADPAGDPNAVCEQSSPGKSVSRAGTAKAVAFARIAIAEFCRDLEKRGLLVIGCLLGAGLFDLWKENGVVTSASWEKAPPDYQGEFAPGELPPYTRPTPAPNHVRRDSVLRGLPGLREWGIGRGWAGPR